MPPIRAPAPCTARPRTLALAALALAAAAAAGAANAQRGGGPPYAMRGDQCVDTSGTAVDISLCKPQQNAIDNARAGARPKMQCKEGKPCGQTCIPEDAACPIK
ncbi:MAG: hypothetical protein JSS35_11430 [Proteobacteria bacterium]|nr:hypothetical protein [Pseudomonadota bacterium]